jgi:hypothetical protein
LNVLDRRNLPGTVVHVTTHAMVNGHDVATEMINTSDELPTPVKRDSDIMGKIEIDGMGRILLRDVTINFHPLTRLLVACCHDARCTRWSLQT